MRDFQGARSRPPGLASRARARHDRASSAVAIAAGAARHPLRCWISFSSASASGQPRGCRARVTSPPQIRVSRASAARSMLPPSQGSCEGTAASALARHAREPREPFQRQRRAAGEVAGKGGGSGWTAADSHRRYARGEGQRSGKFRAAARARRRRQPKPDAARCERSEAGPRRTSRGAPHSRAEPSPRHRTARSSRSRRDGLPDCPPWELPSSGARLAHGQRAGRRWRWRVPEAQRRARSAAPPRRRGA